MIRICRYFSRTNFATGECKHPPDAINRYERLRYTTLVTIDDDHVIASAFRERSPREPGEPGLMPV